MFVYEKKLQYPVKVATPNPKLAAFIITSHIWLAGKLLMILFIISVIHPQFDIT